MGFTQCVVGLDELIQRPIKGCRSSRDLDLDGVPLFPLTGCSLLIDLSCTVTRSQHAQRANTTEARRDLVTVLILKFDSVEQTNYYR